MKKVGRWNIGTLLSGVVIVAIAGGVVWRLAMPSGAAGPDSKRGGAARPVPVLMQPVARKDVPVILDGLGTVQAWQTATIRSRIDSTLEQVLFTEGQPVAAGQLLATLDDRALKAALDQAEATQDKDQAQLEQARLDLRRYQGLGDRVAGQTLDTQKALVRQLEAQLRVDAALVETARAQLSYTRLSAPFAGRAGLRQVDPGNILHSADSAGLVTLTQLQPIAVTFSLPQQQVGALSQALGAQGALPVEIYDADGQTLLDSGKVALIDNQIDATTGTLKLKAELPNSAGKLWPGAFVTVRLKTEIVKNALTVPTVAIQRGPRGPFVYVATAEKTAAVRLVTPGRAGNSETIIRDGLNDGDLIVTEGMARLQDGSKLAFGDGKDGGKGEGKDGKADSKGEGKADGKDSGKTASSKGTDGSSAGKDAPPAEGKADGSRLAPAKPQADGGR